MRHLWPVVTVLAAAGGPSPTPRRPLTLSCRQLTAGLGCDFDLAGLDLAGPSNASLLVSDHCPDHCGPAPAAPPLAIGGARQLFIEPTLIESKQHLLRVLNHPTKHPEPVLQYPAQAVGSTDLAIYEGAVWLDRPSGTWHMWYSAGYYNWSVCWLGYANSSDGVNWQRPDLRIVADPPTTERNNFVLGPNHGGFSPGVLVDPEEREPRAERRFKMMYANSTAGGLVVAFSPDGACTAF